MVQSPSWEANWFAASQEIPHISQNPKVHYRTHKRPPPVSILGQPNPVPIHTSHFLEIHPNIIRPSTPRSPQWSPSLRFPHQDPVHPPLLTHTRNMPGPSHSSRFYHPHNMKKNSTFIANLLYTLLTYSLEHSPSSEANQFSASQEILHILWTLKVHHHIHQCPPRPCPQPDRANPWPHIPLPEDLS